MVKRICYVNPTLLMKRPIAQIASMLSKDKDFRISILTPRLAFGKRDDSLHYSKLEGINVIDYPCINPHIQSEWPIPGLSFLKKSVNILKNNDIIHMWVPFYLSSTFLIFLKRLFFNNKKLILTMDTIPAYSFKANRIMSLLFKVYFRVIGKLIFPGVNAITLYGDSFKKYADLAGMPLEKIRITPTGVNIKVRESDKNIRKEFNIEKDEKIILFVGLLVDRKGTDLIIKTASKLKDKKVKFIIVGDGPCKKKNALLAKKLNVEDKIIFTGFRNDIHNFYNEADIFFFPSMGEGLAGVLIEAANYKIPIVSSKIPGTMDVIENGKTGYLCAMEDVDEYSKRIEELLSDKKLRNSFVIAGRKKIEKQFNWETNLNKFKELYD